MDKASVEQAATFMLADINREIAFADSSERALGRLLLRLAKVPSGGGNFMAALSLLSYTEYEGRLKHNDFSDGNSRKILLAASSRISARATSSCSRSSTCTRSFVADSRTSTM
jgi:hypothetical protein